MYDDFAASPILGEGDTDGAATKKEKLISLLKNQISSTTATKAIFEDMDECDSFSSLDG